MHRAYDQSMLLRRLIIPLVTFALLTLPAVGLTSSAHADGQPTYQWSLRPSPVVLMLPNEQVRLRPRTYCWEGPPAPSSGGGDIGGAAVCVDGTRPRRTELTKVARHGDIRFWFGRPGWRWNARVVSFSHPERAACRVASRPTKVSAQRFDLAAPRYRGTYRVSLFGRGPEGDVTVWFSWKYGKRPGRCS